MPRKLKAYQTSIGFYDLAVAAPSMKAALEAWGADSNLFHQGAAVEVNDAAVVAATLAKPGVVLKRPVGSTGKFGEHSKLPNLAAAGTSGKPLKVSKSKTHKQTPKIDDATKRKAALQFDRQQKKRDAERRREEAAQAKVFERKQRATAKAQSALEDAEAEHKARVGALDAERTAIEKRLHDEHACWEAQETKLEDLLRRAKG